MGRLLIKLLSVFALFCSIWATTTIPVKKESWANWIGAMQCTGNLQNDVACPAGAGPGGPACSNFKYNKYYVGWYVDDAPVEIGNCNTHNYWSGTAWVPCPFARDFRSQAPGDPGYPCSAFWLDP